MMRAAPRPRALLLWFGFLAAHLLIAWQGWIYPSQPMGDVVLVYEPWSRMALTGGGIVGVTESWVYPQLALIPMLATQALAAPFAPLWGTSTAYLLAWAVLVTLLDVIAFGVLVGKANSEPRRIAGWLWIVALALLGPIAMYRIDAVTVPLALIGGLWLVKRPALGAMLVTLGAWVKIWPGALAVAAVAAGRHRMRVLLVAAITAVGVVVLLFLIGAGPFAFGFLSEQTGRGLQVEAVAATPYLWLAMQGQAVIGYSYDILTFQVEGPGSAFVSDLLTPLMILVVAGMTVLGAVASARGASFHRLFPPLVLVLVVALILTNKVGSPQFQTWLIAPALLWVVLDRTRAAIPAVLVLILCGLTCFIYPLTYDALLRAEFVPVLMLSIRNVLLIVLCAVSIRAMMKTTR